VKGLALLAAAAGVGFGHAILPDHWVPLAVVGRARRYPISRVARLSGLAGVAHVLVSIALGAVIIVVGLQLRSVIENAQDTIVGGLLIATGIGFAGLQLTGHGHGHGHSHSHAGADADADSDAHGHADVHVDASGHSHSGGDMSSRGHGHAPDAGHDHWSGRRDHRLHGPMAVMVPFGAAASPDLTILPVFLAATTAGVVTAVGSVVIFAAVTIGTIVGLTLAATRCGYQIRGDWLDEWGNAFTALVLVIIGAFVLIGLI
jgi:hypothetical protein